MRYFFYIAALIFTLMGAGLTAAASESISFKSGKATAQLVTSYDRAMPGDEIHVALVLTLEPHWHTYWVNAGGPGNGAKLKWKTSEGARIGDIIWPLPDIVRTGPIVNYAFEDRLLLASPMTLSEDLKVGQVVTIEMEAMYLVCYDVCLPEMASLSLPIVIGEPVKDGRWSSNINRTIKKAPKAEPGYAASSRLENGVLNMEFTGPDLEASTYRNPYFFPYIQDLINADDAQSIAVGGKGLRVSMAPSYVLEDGLNMDVEGVISFEKETEDGWKRTGVIVRAAPGTSLDIGAVSKTLTPASASGGTSIGLMAALIGAFIGGIILNLMPCVFPVLFLKVLGFTKSAHEDRARIRSEGWLFTIGALVTFLALAGLLIILKLSGAGLGWGFQLQSPIVVGALALLFFIIALNLFGMFEIGGRVQNTGAGLANAGGKKGAFFTGVLAVIVATPCTAPFMAGALGFAFAQPPLVTLLVFLVLGFGFALPFLALSHAPALLKKLPKPGPWMETFKQFMAFPMLATAIWLLWVLTLQSGADGAALALIAMLLAAFGIWLLGRKNRLLMAAAITVLVFSGLSIANLKTLPNAALSAQSATHQNWSPQLVQELRAQGHNVFVDFTAAWCVTCKFNERTVLARPKAQELFASTNTVTLIADWTNKDERIAKELAKYERAGVPMYLLYSAGTNDSPPQVLPQNLSLKILKKALKNAKQG